MRNVASCGKFCGQHRVAQVCASGDRAVDFVDVVREPPGKESAPGRTEAMTHNTVNTRIIDHMSAQN